MACVVSLHFLLPGAMSVLSLIAPDVTFPWRVTFATAEILGFIGAVLVVRTVREEYDAPRPRGSSNGSPSRTTPS
jgi:hypothetical protein